MVPAANSHTLYLTDAQAVSANVFGWCAPRHGRCREIAHTRFRQSPHGSVSGHRGSLFIRSVIQCYLRVGDGRHDEELQQCPLKDLPVRFA
jgi:hypothetical protein